MKNNRIRLTESQLHNVIKESVKRVLREYEDPADMERNGFPSDFDPYNEFDRNRDDDNDNYAYSNYLRHSEALKNGEYDDRLYDKDFINDLYNECEDGYDETYAMKIEDEILERKCALDKDLAFRTYRKYKYPNPHIPLTPERIERMLHIQGYERGDGWKDEIYRQQKRKAWDDKDMRELAKEYPKIYKKNGERRKKYDASWRDFREGNTKNWDRGSDIRDYGTDQADKRPLHRKGSLNRAMNESIRRALKKVLH